MRAQHRPVNVVPGFQIGDRVRLSAEGRQVTSKPPDRLGTIVGFSYSDRPLVAVLWDGLKDPQRWHATFIERENR